jgi:hypothetical protein
VGSAIGDVLPLALGVAISPIPIIAVILMLLSPKARENGPAFLLGWVAGLAVVSILVSALSGNAGIGSGGGGSVWGSLIKLLLGLLLVGFSIREFRNRPRQGDQPQLPGWMRAIDSFTPVRTFGIAVLLSAAAIAEFATRGSNAFVAMTIALTIIVGQLPKLFGIESADGDFFEKLWRFVTGLETTNGWTLLVGIVSLALVVVLRHAAPVVPGSSS